GASASALRVANSIRLESVLCIVHALFGQKKLAFIRVHPRLGTRCYTIIMQPTDPKKRFSSRVADYVRYRPGYPRDILALLRTAMKLTPHWPVADLGAGTGLSSELFVSNGNPVFAVEPNAEMRAAAEQRFGGSANFHSVNG